MRWLNQDTMLLASDPSCVPFLLQLRFPATGGAVQSRIGDIHRWFWA